MTLKSKSKTLVACIQCSNCKDIIYSRTTHDMRYCTCGETFIDGGFDYSRYGSKDVKNVKLFNKYVSVSKLALSTDYNRQTNKYGLIRNKNRVLKQVTQVISFTVGNKCFFKVWRHLSKNRHYTLINKDEVVTKKRIYFNKYFSLFGKVFAMTSDLKVIYETT